MKIGKAGKQKGFTIIELVVVILLLGILTATALPRFMDVTEEAHEAVVNGVHGALQTGVTLFHAQWVANGQPAAGLAVAKFGNDLVVTNADGYPDGIDDDDDDRLSAGSDAACVAIFKNVLQGGAPSVEASNNTNAAPTTFTGSTFKAYAHATDDTCSYAYVATGAVMDTIIYNALTGEVTNP